MKITLALAAWRGGARETLGRLKAAAKWRRHGENQANKHVWRKAAACVCGDGWHMKAAERGRDSGMALLNNNGINSAAAGEGESSENKHMRRVIINNHVSVKENMKRNKRGETMRKQKREAAWQTSMV